MRARLYPLFLLLLAAFMAAGFRLETHTRYSGESREARLNPWLAAGRVLERERLQVRFAPEYGGLPAHADVLVLATPPDYLDENEQAQLLDWVRRGGHLVTELQDVSSGRESPGEAIARQLDVRLREHDFNEQEHTFLLQNDGPRPTRLDREGRILARFQAEYFLEPGGRAPQWQVTDRYGAHALRFAVGRGRISLVSDLAWVSNRLIGKGDHALLLLRLVDAAPGATVWLVHGIERPSLLALVWENAAALLVAMAVFVAAWLWAVSRRFGPLLATPTPARRRLAEHLEASGRYLLRAGGLDRLHDASRQRLLATVQRRHPQWRHLAPPALAEQIAQRAGVEADAVQRVLAGDAPDHLPQFAADIRLLNRLRKAL